MEVTPSEDKRFQARMKGLLKKDRIFDHDVAGTAHRLMVQKEAEAFLAEEKDLKEFVREDDIQDPLFCEAVKRKIATLTRKNLKDHILCRHLKEGQVSPLVDEILYWNINIPEGQPQLEMEDAQHIFWIYELLKDLPRKAHHSNFPLYIDRYTLGHSIRVAILSVLEVKKLNGNGRNISTQMAAIAGFLHDLGKAHPQISELTKAPRKLTDEEYAKIKKHPVIGANAWLQLYDQSYLDKKISKGLHEIVHDGILEHHARPDGKGYPDFVDPENISWIAQILAVADSYDAMVSNRKYNSKKEDARKYALEELKRCSDLPWDKSVTCKPTDKWEKTAEEQFDPLLTSHFVEINPKPIFNTEYPIKS